MDGDSIAPHGKSQSVSIGVRSFVTTVTLDCSFSVDHGEDSYQVRGQCQSLFQCLPGSLAHPDLDELGRRGLIVLLHRLFYSIQHFSTA